MKLTYLLLFCLLSFALVAQDAPAPIRELMDKGEYEKALSLMNTENPGRNVRLLMAEAYLLLGQPDKARRVLPEELPTSEWWNTSGEVYLALGRADRAIQHFEKAVDLAKTPTERARAFNNLGVAHWNDGNTSLSLENHFRALDIRRETQGESSEAVASSFNNIGLVYASSDKDQALDYYEKALAVFKKVYPSSHPKVASVMVNIGIINRELGFFGDAQNHLESAAKIWRTLEPEGHPNEAFILLNLGQTYKDMGQKEAAKGYYQKALDLYRKNYGDKHPSLANALNFMGRLQMEARDFSGAVRTFQQAVWANVSDPTPAGLYVNPSVGSYFNATILLSSLMEKSRALEELHYGSTLKPRDLHAAFHTVQVADTLIDRIRRQRTNKADKIALGNTAQEVYEDGVRMAYGLYEGSFKKKGWLETAFYFAEKSKSAVLIDAIADSKAKAFANIPADVLDEEATLQAEISLVEQLLAQKPERAEEIRLRSRLVEANRSLVQFTHRLEAEYPDYFNLKFNTAQPTVGEIQKSLAPGTAMVSYFLADRTHRIFQFVITPQRFTVHQVAKASHFDRWLIGYRNGLFFSVDQVYQLTARELYKQLFPTGIPSGIHHLVVVPAGRLGTVPFEALLTSSKGSEWRELPYLIRQVSIHYEYSAGLYLLGQSVKQVVGSPSILVCAPVMFEQHFEGVGNLPDSKKEAEAISHLFSSKNFNHTMVLERAASEDFLKTEDLTSYPYLHFATHGMVNESAPELSRLFLSPGIKEDGLFYTGDIYNLKLNSQLVTLSACQTGLGRISRGEGIIGLSRAFLYAGARSLLVSQWNVGDASTAQLMTRFYTDHLESGQVHAAKSLRKAKLELMQSEEFANPFYWAPFVLIGK
jgi:CHAT domain-containing protein/Tfp pilus assembly protein PilF